MTTAGIDFSSLEIISPKRSARDRNGWSGFFPYYAGFPEGFAERVISSARLDGEAKVLDPWNGSGTTTYVSSKLGFRSRGFDINPVMVVVARARTLPPSEADSIRPLAIEILGRSQRLRHSVSGNDPLGLWFGNSTATWVRSVESATREILLGPKTLRAGGTDFSNISALASTFYVSIFSVCLEMLKSYRTSNPTWLRVPRKGERRVGCPARDLEVRFLRALDGMAEALQAERPVVEREQASLMVADTTKALPIDQKFDLVLTSPPYCTRIDYAAATRIQLAVLWPLLDQASSSLGLRMIGSVKVPLHIPTEQAAWGDVCLRFLRNVREHPSKASSGYYLKTHLDYFSKMALSLASLSEAVKVGGGAVLVVQDSFYKDIYNDLPLIISEMGGAHSLRLKRREDFALSRTLANRHPHTRSYRTVKGATESVLCFEKI